MIPAPLYFLSSIWGDEGQETAAFRMISVSLVAGAALLFGALLIYHAVDPHTFLIDGLRGRLTGKTANLFGMEFALNQLAFGLIVLGLALRAPVWPVHGWFRKLILKVPTTVGIAAILGGFPVAITVFTRLGLELFPETISANSDIWVVAGMANLAFGMFSLLQEKDLRGIVVSLSTSFVGLSLLGVGTGHPTGFVGSQFVLFSSVMALSVFGFAAEILRSRVRTYRIDELNGVLRSLPDLGTATLISFASAIGLPGTVGFVAFILLMVGMFNGHASIVLASLGAMVAIGAFMIHTYRMIFLGERQADRFPSLSFRERFLLFPLVVAVVAVGVFPSPLVEIVRNTVVRMLATGATE